MLADLLSSRLAGAWRVQALNVSAFCGTFRAQAAQQAPLFVKSLPAERAAVLHAEADGLAALAATQTVQVPRTVACFEDGGLAVLALQWQIGRAHV